MPDKRADNWSADGIARLASRQHGVVSTRQLYALGLSRDQVMRRARAGWLHRLYRGVYAVGHRGLSEHGRWMAAVLACGRGAVLSHESAAMLWRLRPLEVSVSPAPVDVTIAATAGRRSRVGVRLHQSLTLSSAELTRHNGLPVTTPARTILDLAASLPRRDLERLIDEAERLGLCKHEELAEIVSTHPHRPGVVLLRAVLREHAAGTTVTRSELEERFLVLCREREIPQPQLNIPLLDFIVDCLWPAQRLVVELDGAATHRTRRAFQRDRDRDGRLAVAGYRVLRFTWWDLTRRPAVVVDRVRRMLRPS